MILVLSAKPPESGMLWRKGKAHGQDLRERVFAAADGVSGMCEIARRLFVSVSYVSKVPGRRRQTGETTARPERCHVPARLAAYEVRIEERVAAFPDVTLEELKAWLLAAYGVEASITLIWETLDRLGLTFKKRPFTRPSRIARMSPRPAGPCVRNSRS
jgi:transposase